MYESGTIQAPTLLIIGQADITVVGKNILSEVQKKVHGQYPQPGKKLHLLIKFSELKNLPAVNILIICRCFMTLIKC